MSIHSGFGKLDNRRVGPMTFTLHLGLAPVSYSYFASSAKGPWLMGPEQGLMTSSVDVHLILSDNNRLREQTGYNFSKLARL